MLAFINKTSINTTHFAAALNELKDEPSDN